MATKISGMTAITAGNLDDTTLFETVDKLGATTKSTLAQIRAQLFGVSMSVTGTIASTGNITAGGNAVASSLFFTLNTAAGQQRLVTYNTAGLSRWQLGADAGAEGGGNAGSAFRLTAYDDTGAQIDVPVIITRAAAGSIALTRPIVSSSSGAFTSITASSTVALTGNMSIGANAGAAISLNMNSAAANQRLINYQTAGVLRWAVGAQSDAEGGGNAGSSYVIIARTDAGSAIDTPVTILRPAGGIVSIVRPVTVGAAASAYQFVIDGSAFGAGVASIRFNGLTTAATNNLVGTLTNSPVTGNPTFWMPVSIAGVIKYVPCF